MPSLFDIGKSGLQAYRQSLAVTGQNIANINTEGYKKRAASLEEVSGAGGGGFILFMCEPNKGIKLRNRLLKESVETFFCTFNCNGAEAWIIN